MQRTAMSFVAFSLFFCLSTGAVAKSLENIHLTWKPTTAVKPRANNVKFVERITVEDFTDSRKTPELIGEYRERGGRVSRVTTTDNIAAFATEGFRKSFEHAGFSTVKAGSEISVGADLIRYVVTEENLYKGQIEINVRIKDSAGQPLWSGIIKSSQERWGMSYKADNYFEVLSDLIVNVVNTLVQDPETQKAFVKR